MDGDDDLSSTTSNDNQINQINLMTRATSITNKLSETFNRLTTATTSNLINYLSQDLTYIDQYNFPIQLFNKVFIFFFYKLNFIYFLFFL